MPELFKLLIIGLYGILVYKYYKNTTLLLLFTLATILILCNINKVTEGNWDDQYASPDFNSLNNFDETDISILSGGSSNNGSSNNGSSNNGSANNGPANNGSANNGSANNGPANNGPANNGPAKPINGLDNISPVDPLSKYQMGPYDNIILTNGNPKSKYIKLQTDSLSTENDMCVYQGSENPLQCKKTIGLNIGPSVDGTPDAPKSLFPFTFNKSSPDCCPSTFSTSSGCVCTTENQRKFINRRGMGVN